MKQKALGSQGLLASEIGLGCMGMSEFYGPHDDEESLKTLDRALELGINFWDTSDAYGPHTNEVLVGKAMKGRRQKITLATKFGIVRDPANPMKRGFDGSPAYVRSACEASLRRLDTDVIDLYYLHRVDPATPIEETVGALGQLVKEGKVRAIGLSEVKPETLRRAHATFPISAVQTEYSIWSREPESGSGDPGGGSGILNTCKELGVAFVAYSPLGRGFLTGQIRKFEDLAADDYRRYSPRFQGDNFNRNLELVRKIEELAAQKGCTPSQLALAWVLAQGDPIFPIPGTKRIKYLEENAGALNVRFTPAELSLIDTIAPTGVAAGERYHPEMMGSLNR
jgi:aryl-alcohol dehydrogenase-like predicted oxidoreductase